VHRRRWRLSDGAQDVGQDPGLGLVPANGHASGKEAGPGG